MLDIIVKRGLQRSGTLPDRGFHFAIQIPPLLLVKKIVNFIAHNAFSIWSRVGIEPSGIENGKKKSGVTLDHTLYSLMVWFC